MRICIVEGCDNKHIAKGYCNKHYSKYIRTGNLISTVKIGCKIEGCKNKHYAKEYCLKHYRKYCFYWYQREYGIMYLVPRFYPYTAEEDKKVSLARKGQRANNLL